jgi:hypothetical protein
LFGILEQKWIIPLEETVVMNLEKSKNQHTNWFLVIYWGKTINQSLQNDWTMSKGLQKDTTC